MVQRWKILSSYQCFGGSPWEKCTENLVERILKIDMNVLKCEKHNATARPMIFQALTKFRKDENFRENFEKYRNFEFHRRKSRVYRMERHSTSPPCGNLVDGLPHDCHTEPRWIGLDLDPRISVKFVVGFMFSILYYELLVCYIQSF